MNTDAVSELRDSLKRQGVKYCVGAYVDIHGVRKGKFVPLGATEQHGPRLPVAMDTLLAEAVCHAASERTSVPVLPALRYTTSQGHTTKWPGTVSLRYDTLLATLRDVAAWAVATGWQRLLLVNAHFGNDAPARVAVDQLRLSDLGRLQVGLVDVFKLNDAIWTEYTRDAADLHVNQAETALMLHLHPELVHLDRIAAADDPDRNTGTVFSHPVAQTRLNGVTGHPSRAAAEQGRLLFESMINEHTATVGTAIHELPPPFRPPTSAGPATNCHGRRASRSFRASKSPHPFQPTARPCSLPRSPPDSSRCRANVPNRCPPVRSAIPTSRSSKGGRSSARSGSLSATSRRLPSPAISSASICPARPRRSAPPLGRNPGSKTEIGPRWIGWMGADFETEGRGFP